MSQHEFCVRLRQYGQDHNATIAQITGITVEQAKAIINWYRSTPNAAEFANYKSLVLGDAVVRQDLVDLKFIRDLLKDPEGPLLQRFPDCEFGFERDEQYRVGLLWFDGKPEVVELMSG